ncbi:MAG: phosphate ABC transporter permease PstA [Halobacteriovoraceae bacterium]|nr:phosphate ABC transporter permease PstA [Halobacteriovoraceae bacterium]
MNSTRTLKSRRIFEKFFKLLCIVFSWFVVLILSFLIYKIVQEGYDWLNTEFLTALPSRFPHKAGIKTALVGSFWLMGVTAAFAIPVGIASALYLEEYGGKGRFSRFIDLNISNLAGVPSIVYGLLGLAIFVHTLGFGRSVLSGGLTLSLLILPIIIISSRGAIKSVPKSLRMAAYALGARKWQVIFGHVLPNALPGIMTGVILSLSRAIGETAPLIIVGALSYVAFVPENIYDEFTTLPIQIFNWTSRPKVEFHYLSAAGIIVLLIFMFTMNLAAVLIRHKTSKKL